MRLEVFANMEGRGKITIGDLMKNALRMRRTELWSARSAVEKRSICCRR